MTDPGPIPRREYVLGALTEAELGPEPLPEVRRWVGEAAAAGLPDETPMTLATVDPDGAPSARIVLLRGVDERGLRFFTNYDSAKARDLAANPRAALLFHWPPGRQVRTRGPVTRVGEEESDAYWATRPRGSQLGAWASRQSEVIAGRAELERRLAEVTARFQEAVPRPPFWGGYRVAPETIEFWHHRDDRLHDRLRYRRADDGRWVVERLSP